GEVPDPGELAATAGEWMMLDGALQTVGAGIACSRAVRNIAEAEGGPAKEVLSRLWTSTKKFAKTKFGRTIEADIEPADVEVSMEKAKQAEENGLQAVGIEVEPIKESYPGSLKQEVDTRREVEGQPKTREELRKEYLKNVKPLPLEEIENLPIAH